MAIELTFLGTGTSQGVPMIGCDCGVCTSDDPRDRRGRTSCLMGWDRHRLLLDATPELRLQCLQNDVRRVDAVLITHTHADHFLGMDDLRRFCQMQRQVLPVFVGASHYESLVRVFGYAQDRDARGNPDLPHFEFWPVAGPFCLFDIPVVPLLLPHGAGRVTAYRLGPLAYCTDVSELPEEVYEDLEGLEVLVLGALRPQAHPAHLSISQAVQVARRIAARRTYLVHMGHQVHHRRVEAELPEGIHLAHDGLTVRF
ncbi:MAG: MBL fold metallo-hydrolase [Sedimentisphaerales bacterium]|nr:MBL fold metallo-hydrolase [Sedimentisphaerales bacterium]